MTSTRTMRSVLAALPLRRLTIIMVAAVVAGCAAVAPEPTVPAPTPAPANREPPPPNVNLSGFPLPYRQGYADGCASATGSERKDAARFAADPNYRTGWQDGVTLCKKKN